MTNGEIRKWIATELSKDIDNLHAGLNAVGLPLDKKDVSKLISAQHKLNGNGKFVIIIVKESKLRSRGKTHEIEEEPYGIFEVPEMRLRR